MTRSRSSRKQMPEKIDVAKAAALLKAAEQQKIDRCGDELEKLLAKHGCILEPQIIIRGTRIYAQMVIIANPTPNQQTQMQKITDLQPVAEEEKEE